MLKMVQPPYYNHAVPGSNPGHVKNILFNEFIYIYQQLLLLIKSIYMNQHSLVKKMHFCRSRTHDLLNQISHLYHCAILVCDDEGLFNM